jgi:hypothetical protein
MRKQRFDVAHANKSIIDMPCEESCSTAYLRCRSN